MSVITKGIIQRILLIALSASTLSMVCISLFNYRENEQKEVYLDAEKLLVQEELMEIMRNYDYLKEENIIPKNIVLKEKEKIQLLLTEIKSKELDYESILIYRKQLVNLRNNNLEFQKK